MGSREPLAISMQMGNYNLPGLNQQHLKLSGPLLAVMYQGKIRKWNDSQVAALNPGVKLPDHDIILVHRTDGSGDTFIFTHLWGYVVVIPFLGYHLSPLMVQWLGFIPFFGGPAGSGYGLLTAGCVLTLMIVPLITATVRDALVSQEAGLREGALALGATRFEALWTVLLPNVRRVVIGSRFSPPAAHSARPWPFS